MGTATATKTRPAIAYYRVSDDKGGTSRSVDDQRQSVRRWARANGWRIVAEEVDEDISASRYSRKARPGWARVRAAVDAGAVEGIVAWDLDRLLRQPKELEALIDRTERGALVVQTLGGGDVNLATPDGRFVARILVAKAAKESDDISRRVRRAKEARAREGRVVGKLRACYGYSDNGMTVVPEQAAVIREMADRVLAGEGVTALARDLTARGVPTATGGTRWSPTTISDMLRNPRVAGLAAYNGEVLDGVSAAWPAILDRETWQSVVAVLESRIAVNSEGRRVHDGARKVSLLTGVLHCGKCHEPMYRDLSRGRLVYRCKPSLGHPAACGGVAIAGPALEALIVEMLLVAIDTGSLPERRTSDPQAAADLAIVEADLAAIAGDFGAGRISRGEWLAAREGLEARRAALTAATVSGVESTPLDRWRRDGKGLRGAWETMTTAQRNALLRAAFVRIEVAPTETKGAKPKPEDRIRDGVVWRA